MSVCVQMVTLERPRGGSAAPAIGIHRSITSFLTRLVGVLLKRENYTPGLGRPTVILVNCVIDPVTARLRITRKVKDGVHIVYRHINGNTLTSQGADMEVPPRTKGEYVDDGLDYQWRDKTY